METDEKKHDPLTVGVGNKDLPTINPATVRIMDASLQPKKEGKLTLLNLSCKHPNKEEVINLSKIKILEGEKLKTLSLWVAQDDDGQIQKGSSVALLLQFLNAENVKALEGMEIMTVKESEDSKYLVLKCYN